jgi:hypothetical protein
MNSPPAKMPNTNPLKRVLTAHCWRATIIAAIVFGLGMGSLRPILEGGWSAA